MILRLSILMTLAFLLISCNENLTPDKVELVGEVKLLFKHTEAPTVGEDLLVLTTCDIKKNIPMILVMTSGLAVRKYDIFTHVKLVIPGNHVTESGRYTFTVLYGDEIQAEQHVNISAGSIINPLDLYTGPRSILVGGKQNSMITTIPTDQYDNGITKNTSIQISTDRANKDSKNVNIKNLVAVYKLTSDNESKIITAGVSKNVKSSKAQAIIQEPDWATDFTIEVSEQYPYADNNHYTKLRTNRLTDRYGNQVANGTLVTFDITAKDGAKSKYNGIVIDGYANVNMRNPSRPTSLQIVAYIGPYSQSNTMNLEYTSIIKSIPFRFNHANKVLEIGPIVAHEGQFIPDGTKAILSTDTDETIIEVIDGEGKFNLIELGYTNKEILYLNISGLEQKIVIK